MSTTIDTVETAAHATAPATRGGVLSRVIYRVDVFTGRLLFAVMLVALLASPFEVGYPPLGHIFFATFTNLEVVLLGLGAALLLRLVLSREARRRLLHLPLLLPIVALLLACVISSLFGEFKSLGMQFTYRLCMGVVVFVSVAEALRGSRRLFAALTTLVTAALLSACLGLLEFVPWFNAEPWLKPFKPQPTTVGGMLRLSGTFEYANGAAVYFEMALPLLVGLALLFSSGPLVRGLFGPGRMPEGRRRLVQLVLYAGVGVLTCALILTFSRAAWLGIAVAVAVLGGVLFLLARRPAMGSLWASMRLPLALASGVIALAAVYIYATDPLLRLRLTGENDRAWYNYGLTQQSSIAGIAASDVVTVPVLLTNPGPMRWNADRVPTVHISYHWKKPGSAYYEVFDGLRTPLPHDVTGGQSVRVDAYVQAPTQPGVYVLEWDLVQEDVAWFSQKSKMRPESAQVAVGAPDASARPAPAITRPPVSVEVVEESDTSTVARGQLWRVAFAMFRAHPLTGVGPDGFRNLYGKYAGTNHWNSNIYTNNTYIEMFTDLGLTGGLAFLWLAGLALWHVVRNLRLSGKVPGQPSPASLAMWVVCLGVSAALVAFLLHGLVDYFLFSTPLYTIFWFVLAVSVLWPRLVLVSNTALQKAHSEPVKARTD